MALAALARGRRNGSSLLAGLTVPAVLAVVFATFGLPQAGAATRPGAVRLIDTHRIIGLPRQLAAVAQTASGPTVTAQPTSESVVAGSTASFSSAASGSPTPTVRWQVSTNHGSSWTNVAAITSTTFSFTTSSAMNGNEYRAVFTNSAGSATTTAASLTVTTVPTIAPSITAQPASESVVTGSTASFSAAASGSPTPTVHWQVSNNHGSSWTNVASVTSTTYSFAATTSANGNGYRAVFTNSAGSATTSAATLTVTTVPTTTPTITTQPASETVVSGATASFSSAATGSPTPTVHWQVSTNHGSSWTNVASVTSTTYSFTASSSVNGNQYRAVFTNSAGSATSAAATLTVTTVPTITTQPASTTVTPGSTVSFSAAASGSPVPSAQWWISINAGSTWTAIAAATSTTYSFTATSSANGTKYRAVFTNSAGSATTIAGTLTVSTTMPTSTGASTNWSGYADTGATFSAVTGSWNVPTVTCSHSQTAYSSHWIGIDGAASNTVEQDGTEADCLNGSPSYDAWYEMYGDSAVNGGFEVELSPSAFRVSPGDSMSASVSVVGTTWTLAIADSTRGWSFSTHVAFSAARSSAEWIVERPELCGSSCSLASLATFSTVTISNATASTATIPNGAINSFPNLAIEMVSANTSAVLALPSALSSSGQAFTDTWKGTS